MKVELLEKARKREREARKEAESILERRSLELYNTNEQLKEALKKKKDFLWKSSVKGLTREAHFNFGHKKGEKQNIPKTPKMAIFDINFLGKCPKVPKTLYFHQKFHNV